MLYLRIQYDIKSDNFEIAGNVKAEKIEDIVSNFLRAQIEAGADNSESNKHDIYTINICLDLSQDIFYSSDDCGNNNLRNGILMRYLSKQLALNYREPKTMSKDEKSSLAA